MALGDIILIRGQAANPVEWAIMRVTNGPYVHVEIDVGMEQSVGALTTGISLHSIPVGNRVVVVSMDGKLDKKRTLKAALWLRRCVRNGNYGFTDTVMALFAKLRFAFRISVSGRMDCSHLAANFLELAGYDFPPGWLDTAAVSPNDIARTLGVLPQKSK